MMRTADAASRTTSQQDVEFLANLDFLKGWSQDCLLNHGGSIESCRYRRSAVIVRNSNCSRWICVIKSGSANVLSALEETRPNLRQQRRNHQPSQSTLDGFYDSSGIYNPNSIRQVGQARQPYPRRQHEGGVNDESIPGPLVTQLPVRRPQTGTRSHQHDVQRRQRPVGSATARQQAVTTARRAGEPFQMDALHKEGLQDDEDEDDRLEDPAASLVASNQLNRRFHHHDDGTQQDLPQRPQYVSIQTLLPGSVFGLQDLFRTDQPSLSLVSNGATCMMLDKAYFVRNSPKTLLDRLRNQINHYPSRPALQRLLQERVNWEAFKRLQLKDVLRDAGRL